MCNKTIIIVIIIFQRHPFAFLKIYGDSFFATRWFNFLMLFQETRFKKLLTN